MLYLQLFLDDYRYIISTEHVAEITPWVKLTKVPKTPEYIVGLCSYRGLSVPVIDICELFLGRPCKRKLSTRIIFLESNYGSDNGKIIGILAEKATEIIRINENSFMSPGIYGSDIPFIGPVVADEDGLITKLMPKEIFSKIDKELLFDKAI
ncbi:MAG: chemotaxis protein CheW [Anaerolineales bacterium]